MICARHASLLFVVIVLSAGCSSAADTSPPAALSYSAVPTASLPVSPSATPAVPRQLSGRVVGTKRNDTTYPSYSVEVPAGWSSTGEFVIRAAPVIGLSVWDATQVPTDPCHWHSTMTTPGPTVDDLVNALVAQRTRNASTPIEATLAGYKGMYLEWSVPADMVDGEKCDPWPDNGYRDFVSFLGVGDSERYQQMAHQVDRLWVLDVNGRRLVVDATYSPEATDAQKAELDQVAESLMFDEP